MFKLFDYYVLVFTPGLKAGLKTERKCSLFYSNIVLENNMWVAIADLFLKLTAASLLLVSVLLKSLSKIIIQQVKADWSQFFRSAYLL